MEISIFIKRKYAAEQSNSGFKIHYPHFCVVFKGHSSKNIAFLAEQQLLTGTSLFVITTKILKLSTP